ncbi:hypothetical protein LUZ60_013668 [Juncus effusus]|nr:hypothetical protein LUZ60_013668 [Juncus effusus]
MQVLSNTIINELNGTVLLRNVLSQWSSLPRDLLISIFSRLSTADLLVSISAVCSAWRAAARNARFWRILDLSDWNYITCLIPGYVSFEQVFHRVLRLVRECELIEQVYVPRIADGQDLSLVSDRLPNLLYFSFPNAQVPGLMVYSALINFKSLKGIVVFPNFVLSTKVISLLNQYSPDLSELKLFAEKFGLGKNQKLVKK